MQPQDPSQMRVSDADRHRVAEVLREAAAEGRLDLDELDERLGAAYAAKVYADLVPLTLDLPGPSVSAPAPQFSPQFSASPVSSDRTPAHQTSMAMMSEVKRTGRWVVPPAPSALAVMGSVVLDLRQAEFTVQETVITAVAFWGEVKILVNAGTRVVMDGVGFMGEFQQGTDRVPADIAPGAPVVRVKGLGLMGSVKVTRKRMPGEPGPVKKLLGG
jgi:hypothetical protein